MHSHITFVLSVLPLLASSSPVQPPSGPGTYQVAPVGGYPVPVPLVKRVGRSYRKRAIGDDALTDFQNALWYGTISVGTPPVDYTVQFDTGSSGLFLPDSSCSSSACKGHTKYDPSSSSTSQDLGQTGELAYGDGSNVSGELYSDTVSIAGLKAKNQTLLAADTYSDSLSTDEFPPDGLLGMAFADPEELGGATPLVQSLIEQGQTDEPVFAFKLSENGAELSVGGVDNSLFKGDFTNVDVTDSTSWQVTLDDLTVDGKSALASSSPPALIDTGTTLIIGDSSSVEKFYSQIPSSSPNDDGTYYTIPCDFNQSVSLVFGGTAFSVDPSIFVLPVSDGTCIGGLVADSSSDEWIVGDIFLRNVYTRFDIGNRQVGFADLA